ncbi:EGF-like domain-containing protein [Cavenderia fasciculata]|uniref:EGF-like domain-containing protein n=1 Tax=Cavenderia fasciculata TaxID=261658 RepID=F4PKY8_CACFS|nr:EGF-like domain-containing protein [Cavenderia fasciculata]EGG23210.1 EGF-like domain-containing protein [Cavenderia fasciculata]|eukprot:XP_004361061.1 EGF-like domain-containing protein [Cavenderia fasciculata]
MNHEDENQLLNSIIHSRIQLERGLVSIFHYFLNHSNQHIRNESALCILNISSHFGYSNKLVEEGVLESLIKLFHKESSAMFGAGTSVSVQVDADQHQMMIVFIDYIISILSNVAAEEPIYRDEMVVMGVASRHTDILLRAVERYQGTVTQDLLLELIQDCTSFMAALSITSNNIVGVLPLVPSIKASLFFNDEMVLQNALRSFILINGNTQLTSHATSSSSLSSSSNPFNLSFNPSDFDMIKLINTTITSPVNIVSRLLFLIEQFYFQQQNQHHQQHHQQQQTSVDYLTLELLLSSLSTTLFYFNRNNNNSNTQFLVNTLKMVSQIIINEPNNDIVDISCKLLYQLVEITLTINTNIHTVINLSTLLNSVLSRDYYSHNIVYLIEFFLNQKLIIGHQLDHAIGHLIQSLSYHLAIDHQDTCNYILLVIDRLVENQGHLFKDVYTCRPTILNQQLSTILQQYINNSHNNNNNSNNNNETTTTILNATETCHFFVDSAPTPNISGMVYNKPSTQYVGALSQSCNWTVSFGLVDPMGLPMTNVLFGAVNAQSSQDAYGSTYYYAMVYLTPDASNSTASLKISVSVTTSVGTTIINTTGLLMCILSTTDPANAFTVSPPFYDPLKNKIVVYATTTTLATPDNICVSSTCSPWRVIADHSASRLTRERIYELTFMTSSSVLDNNVSLFGKSTIIPPIFNYIVLPTVLWATLTVSFSGIVGGMVEMYVKVEMSAPSVLYAYPTSKFFPYEGTRTNGTYLYYFYTTDDSPHLCPFRSEGTSNYPNKMLTLTFSLEPVYYFIDSEMIIVNSVKPQSSLVSVKANKNVSPTHLTMTYDTQTFSRYILHTFPFSYGAGRSDLYVSTLSLIAPSFYQYSPMSVVITTVNASQSADAVIQSANQDIIIPQLLAINYEMLDYNTGIIKMHVSDVGSGVYKISIVGNDLTINDLLNGTVRLGWYAKTITFDQFDQNVAITIEDMAGNVRMHQMGTLFVDENKVLQTIPNIYEISRVDALNIIDFTYMATQVDVTTKTQLFWIAFNLKFAPFPLDRWTPQVLLQGYGMATQRKIVYGKYADAYYVRWEIPVGTIPGEMFPFMLINRDITSQLLQQRTTDVGMTTPLIINTGYTESIGPKISINATTTTTYTIPQGNGGIISWTGQIYGRLFKEGSVVIQSSIDPLPYEMTINPDPSNQFILTIPIASNCRDQNFTITRLQVTTIVDEVLVYDYYGTSDSFNPLKNAQVITIMCTLVDDTEPPVLDFWNVTEVVPRYRYIVNFRVKEIGISGIASRHNPVVYALNSVKQLLAFDSVRSGSDGFLSNYQAVVELPYGYALGGGFALSIYGLVDNTINFNGYSTDDLIAEGYNAFFSMADVLDPVISSVGTLVQDSKGVGRLVVKGDGFGSPLQLATVKGIITCDGGAVIPVPAIETLPYQLTLYVSRPLTSAQCTVAILVDGSRMSGATTFNVSTYTPPPVVTLCPGNCNSRGNCTTTGCVCTPPYIGSDCLGQSDNSTKTVIDQNVPTTNFQTNQTTPNNGGTTSTTGSTTGGGGTTNTTTSLTTTISLVEIVEMDLDDNTVISYSQLNWTSYNITTNSTEKQVYLYNTTIQQDNGATVNVTLEYLTMEQTYNFANQNFTVPAQSVKYAVGISNYKFASQLNHMVLLFNTSIGKDECASKEAGYLDSDNNLLSWVQLIVGQNVLYARFQQNAMVDDRVVAIQNAIVQKNNSASTGSSNNTALIGINLPIFSSYAIIDPDFSLLITDKKSNTKCINGEIVETNEEDSSNWKIIVIAVVCGVVGATIITISSIYIIKKNKWKIREYSIKLKRAVK